MQYLRDATRNLGITVVCNLHQVDLAREFGDRIVGLAHGRVVFDSNHEPLDEVALRRIYPVAGDSVETFADKTAAQTSWRCA
ncbi:phosphonate/organophosphate ester transporter subunit [compost metagenome]